LVLTNSIVFSTTARADVIYEYYNFQKIDLSGKSAADATTYLNGQGATDLPIGTRVILLAEAPTGVLNELPDGTAVLEKIDSSFADEEEGTGHAWHVVQQGANFDNHMYGNLVVDENGKIKYNCSGGGTYGIDDADGYTCSMREKSTVTPSETPAPPSETPAPSAPAHVCDESKLEWSVSVEATEYNDGEMIYYCPECGRVYERIPVSAYKVFNYETANKIKKASQGATIEIKTRRWISFGRVVMQALADRPDVTLKVSFLDGEYKGDEYEFVIPAGTDTISLLDENGFSGFIYLGNMFGMTPVEN
jgi:hypothetical protein